MSSWSGWPEQWPGDGVAAPGRGTGTCRDPGPCAPALPPNATGAVSPAGAARGIQVLVAL